MASRSHRIWTSKNTSSPGRWNYVSIDLRMINDFKLILEGTIPSGNPNAKICVDNITSSAEPCKKPEPKESKNVPSYNSWVELYGMTFAGALALGLTIPIAVFIVCLFERKRRRGMKNKRIIRHADELDLPEGMNANSYEETNPLPHRYTTSTTGAGGMCGTVGVGNPRLMTRAMSTPSAVAGGVNGQGGNYTMGKRNGPGGVGVGAGVQGQPGMQGPGGQGGMGRGMAAHTMGRGGNMDNGWMMSSQHGDLMENDEYTIDPDYTTHRQMSVPANGYIPVSSGGGMGMAGGNSDGAMHHQQQQQQVGYGSRPIPMPVQQQQQQAVMNSPANNVGGPVATGGPVSTSGNNPFGAPGGPVAVTAGAGQQMQDNRSVAGSHAATTFSVEDGANRNAGGAASVSGSATPGLPFYPPRYEEAMGFNPHHGGSSGMLASSGQPQAMEEKPPLLPPRIPDGGAGNSQAGPSCSTPLPPAPPPLPLSGHPASRFQQDGAGGQQL